MRLVALVVVLAVLNIAPECAGHGAIVHPPSRNAIDYGIEPWKSFKDFNGQFCSGSYRGPCYCPITDAAGKLSGANGQACWWFSNGCSIGCPTCDGVTRGPIYAPDIQSGDAGCADMRPHNLNNHTADASCARKMDTCGLKHNTSVCDPALRTYNRNAACRGPDDWYQYAPWRARELSFISRAKFVVDSALGMPTSRLYFDLLSWLRTSLRQLWHGRWTPCTVNAPLRSDVLQHLERQTGGSWEQAASPRHGCRMEDWKFC